MAARLIPEDVRKFISENVDSIAELEALLLMRSDPDIGWTAASLAKRLYASQEQAAKAIAKLHLLGLIEVLDGDQLKYFYRPKSAELDRIVSDVSKTYSKYLIPVTNLIHSKPRSRIQQFADAFKLREREDK